ncbi:LysE family translocator [Staphylococcus gallinarum]|uniref:LysE family translocator n=1 Tax=Staphylococcus gallinarum TaxID=1293 RepID=A0A3A0VUA1_STAGA|nr:LysE family transporter [Staphylococcus gallinarum]RIP37015.1 LysE family translocator [Staphylococcus gallinarum]
MAAFLIYVFVTSITPGPSNLYIFDSTKAFGIKGAQKFIEGILAGFLFLAILSVGLLFLFEDIIVKIEVILKYLGFFYLIYLSYKTYQSSRKTITNHTYQSFKAGFLLQILNMKSLLFFTTLVGAFILPIANKGETVYLYMIMAVLIGWLCLLAWSLLGNFLQKYIEHYDRPFKILMSLLLLYSAISIFL